MADPKVLARSSVTVTYMIDIVSQTRWYLSQASTLNAPIVPQDNTLVPSQPWTDTEPEFNMSNSLYYTDQTVFSDGSCTYSCGDGRVAMLSSSYEAAKAANSNAISAQGTASAAYNRALAKYAYCEDAAATSNKSITCSGFTLQNGIIINILFKYGNSASSFALNVNGTGTKGVRFNDALTGSANPFLIAPNTAVSFCYTHVTSGDAGYWIPIPVDTIIKGTCSESATVPAKTISITNGVIHVGTAAVIKFTNGNTNVAPTLNISSLGAISLDVSTFSSWVANKSLALTLEKNDAGNGVRWHINVDSFYENFYEDRDGAHVDSAVGTLKSLWGSSAIQFKDGNTILSEFANDHATIGKTGSTDNNTYISSSGMDVRKGTTVLSRFADGLIELGKNALSSVIKMCQGLITISAVQSDTSGGSGFEYNLEATISVDARNIDTGVQYNSGVITLDARTKKAETDTEAKSIFELIASPWSTGGMAFLSANYISIADYSRGIFLNGPGGVYSKGSKTVINSDGYPCDGDGNVIKDKYMLIRKAVITDLNQDLGQGFYYYSSDATGVPTAAGGTLMVLRTSGTYWYQLAFTNASNGEPHMFFRMHTSSGFADWVQVSKVGHTHSEPDPELVFDVNYTPSAASKWDRVGTATTSKFTTTERGLYYIYCSARRSGLGINEAGSSATVTRTDIFNEVDPDGNLRRTGLFYLPAGTFYVYARAPGTASATIRVYRVSLI